MGQKNLAHKLEFRKYTMTKPYLDSIDCSDQPLDLSFHPKRDNLVAVALVDGTLEGTYASFKPIRWSEFYPKQDDRHTTRQYRRLLTNTFCLFSFKTNT
jgi:hypothetical protein